MLKHGPICGVLLSVSNPWGSVLSFLAIVMIYKFIYTSVKVEKTTRRHRD